MSETISTDVFCDVDNCGQWIHGTTGPQPDRKAARRRARSHGWQISDNNSATCPHHLPIWAEMNYEQREAAFG